MINDGENEANAIASEPPRELIRAVPERRRSGRMPAEEHFATGHLLTGLKGRTISSGIVTSLAQGAQFVLSLASIMVLARILTPQDFGLVAMVTTIMGFLRIFNDGGLSTATVQREGITQAQVSNLFWTNVALGGLISLILAVCAPLLAWFYREPRLVGITLALCISFLLSGSTVQHLALLKRQMRFKMIAVIQVSAAMVGVLAGIVMAWLGCGYWSLVGMQLSTPVVAFFVTWWASRWRPQAPTRRSGTRSLLNFGANLTASSFLWSLARGSDGLLIGRLYGSVSLGLYSRAQALLQRPIEQFVAPLEAVFVPTLSRLQSQPERYRRIVFQAYEAIAVISFLFTGLLLALAHPLTLMVLGAKWEAAAPIFAGLTFVALYTPIASVAGWLLVSQGRGRDFLIISSTSSLAAVLSFLVGLRFGPVGVALSYSMCCLFIQMPVAYHVAGRSGPVTARDLWSRFFKHLPLWIVVCCATWLMRTSVAHWVPLAQIAVCVPVGLLVGAAFIGFYAPARRTVMNLFSALQHWREFRAGPVA